MPFEYYNIQEKERCRKENCSYNNEEEFNKCGAYCFLKRMDEALKKITDEKVLDLISSLKEEYMDTWNKYPESGGRGKATGTAFERWVKNTIENQLRIKSGNNKVELGTESFKFTFNADIVILDSEEKPKVILEVKMSAGPQALLFCYGLLALSNKIKLGLITLYEINENCQKILEKIKEKFPQRFGYFCIETGWSKTIEKIKSFIENSLKEEK